jgi:hypothetical protein
MRSRHLLKIQVGAVTAALCVYAGLIVFKSHRYTAAFADTRLGDAAEVVTRRFGVAPNDIEWPHSGYMQGFTMLPCSLPCDERLVWLDPTSVFRKQAYYFEFDANRRLIHKTHYEHLDEAFLRSEERFKEGMKREDESGLVWSSTDAERFRAAKVIALVRLLEPPQFDTRDYSWQSKFVVMRSWKGPFNSGAPITTTGDAMCYGPDCPRYPGQPGQLWVLYGLGDAQPIYPIIESYGIDESRVEETVRKLDELAARTRT